MNNDHLKRMRRLSRSTNNIRPMRQRNVDPTSLFGDPAPMTSEEKIKAQMHSQRQRHASLNEFGPSGAGIQMATGRPRDPMWYWKQNNLPFNFTDPAEMRKIREFMRLLYITHPTVAACIDIYSKLPLSGMSLKCKDPDLEVFYTDLFFDQLNYEDHLVKMGRRYWCEGECFTIGAWNETLGVWEDEQLINPDDVEVETSLFVDAPRFLMRLPESLRNILNNRSPAYEYHQLMQEYPELAQYTDKDSLLPVSNYIMHQLMFEADDYSNRGISILMRAFRTIIQEEMLMSALDSIADRLYTPFIIAKLGASATDLGTNVPWIPTLEQKQEFSMGMDAALAADFRVMVTHFATEVESLFGRENVPDLSNDFDRIQERILMAFGLSQTLLTGACLTGDTQIQINRGHKGSKTTIEHLYKRYNEKMVISGMPWDYSIPTYIARAENGVIRLGKMKRVWQSGTKEVFELTTDSGRTIKASKDHPFMTDQGWTKLEDLAVGDEVQVDSGQRSSQRKAKKRREKVIATNFHPNQIFNGTRNGKSRHKILYHRAMIEASLNEMTIEEFGVILRHDEIRSKELIYIPRSLEVHHLDGDHANNKRDNLVLLTSTEHSQIHSEDVVRQNYVLYKVGVEKITSIRSMGEEMTYDLEVEDEPHNFLANGFVVHNSQGETFAADALNRDVVSNLLEHYQRKLKLFFRARAEIVAEAQEHYDYEVRDGERFLITEEIYEVDEETGEGRIVEQPKLLYPTLEFKTISLTDEQVKQDYIEQLAAAGVPIPIRLRVQTIDIDYDEMIEMVMQEKIDLAVKEQEQRRETYKALVAGALPIPMDLLKDFSPQAMMGPGAMGSQPPLGASDVHIPGLGDTPQILPNLAPAPEDLGLDQEAGGEQMLDQQTNEETDPASEGMPQTGDDVPPESSSMKSKEPKPPKRPKKTGMRKLGIKHATAMHYREPDNSQEKNPSHFQPTGKFGAPKHIGMRRYLHIPDEIKYLED